jgi:hypothetical protein
MYPAVCVCLSKYACVVVSEFVFCFVNTGFEHLGPNVKLYTSYCRFFIPLCVCVFVAVLLQCATSIRFRSVCHVCFNIYSFSMFSVEEFVICITRYCSGDVIRRNWMRGLGQAFTD